MMNTSIKLRFAIPKKVWGVVLFVIMLSILPYAYAQGAGDGGVYHPGSGCLQTANQSTTNNNAYFVPGPPGLPCTPDPTPEPLPDQPSSTGRETSQAKQGPVRLTVSNQSETPISVVLNGPGLYILNINVGESKTFVIANRGLYSYSLTSCNQISYGSLDISTITTWQVDTCIDYKLVKIYLENNSNTHMAIQLNGPENLVIPVLKDQTRYITIPKGDYTYTFTACGSSGTGTLKATSYTRLSLTCP